MTLLISCSYQISVLSACVNTVCQYNLPLLSNRMSHHTIPEYCDALEKNTCMKGFEVEVLTSVSSASRADMIYVLLKKVELWQFRDIGDLAGLKGLLPQTLHAEQPDLNARIEVLRFSQKPMGLEQLQCENTYFSDQLDTILSKEFVPSDPMSVVLELRKRVEVLVWKANEFFVAQLVRDIRKIEVA